MTMSCRGCRHDNNDSLVWIQKRCDCLLMPYITIPICGQSILFPFMLNCLTIVNMIWNINVGWRQPQGSFHLMHQKGGNRVAFTF